MDNIVCIISDIQLTFALVITDFYIVVITNPTIIITCVLSYLTTNTNNFCWVNKLVSYPDLGKIKSFNMGEMEDGELWMVDGESGKFRSN